LKPKKIPVYFHHDQLQHKPMFEWAFGEKISHPETTSRAESILAAMQAQSERYHFIEPQRFPLSGLRDIHNKDLITVYKAAMSLPIDKTFYPTVFPQRRDLDHLDPRNVNHAGAYCFDSGTPLNATTWAAAAWSASCADLAAKAVVERKQQVTYALCRPPGHHASKDLFGGYCYFNNAAIAANRLRKLGSVAIVDIDFHHGNGTQSLYYADDKVLFVSIHGDPRDHYPYYWGFAEETGQGYGRGFNLNFPLPAGCDGQEYLKVLQKRVIPALKAFQPKFLVLSAGFDTYVGDSMGTFSLETPDYFELAAAFASLQLPTVVIQEGGYNAESLGQCVTTFLAGFTE